MEKLDTHSVAEIVTLAILGGLLFLNDRVISVNGLDVS